MSTLRIQTKQPRGNLIQLKLPLLPQREIRTSPPKSSNAKQETGKESPMHQTHVL